MPRLQKRNFENADDVRQFGHGRFDVVHLDETAVGRILSWERLDDRRASRIVDYREMRDPASLTSWMIAAFAGKMLFFGAYVAVMLKALSLAPVPFVASFAGYFIALHLFEALSLRAMFAGTATGDATGGLGD